MKSKKLTGQNATQGSYDSLLVEGRDYNNLVDDLQALYPIFNQPFSGVVNLSKYYTHYTPWTCTSDVTLTIANDPTTMGGAFIRIIGDGSHTVTFTAFKKLEGSQDWDGTLNAINACSFIYDGIDYWYQIDREAI